MSEGNSDSPELNEINVEVVPLEDNAGSAVLVEGVIPEAVEELVNALIGYSVSLGLSHGYDMEKIFSEALELNQPRDPSKMH